MSRPKSWHGRSFSASMPTPGTTPRPSSSNPTTSSGPDIATEFLARKQAVLQSLLGKFPALPQLVALCVAYCTVFCVCLSSLVLLFLGSFVLTGQDQVVARFRRLVDVDGLGGWAGAAVGWAMQAAMGLAAAATGVATGGNPSRRTSSYDTPRSAGTSRSRPSAGPRRASAHDYWQQSQRERPSATYNRHRASYSTGYARNFADSRGRTF